MVCSSSIAPARNAKAVLRKWLRSLSGDPKKRPSNK